MPLSRLWLACGMTYLRHTAVAYMETFVTPQSRSDKCVHLLYSPRFLAATSLYLLCSESVLLKKCVMLPSSFATK